MKNFAITGVAGYIAPRHLKAIRDTGNRLVAACDPNDAVGVLDQYSFDVRFFTEIERFDRHLEKLKRGPEQDRVHYVSVCSPNYLHDAHCRLGLRIGADVVCEKPLVINPWNLDALHDLENETGHRIYTVLQLRTHPVLLDIEQKLRVDRSHHDVELTYVTSRGRWYDVSWKGDESKSGGIPTNIGIHFFDMLLWLFGGVQAVKIHLRERRRWAGVLELERARVRWFLSVERDDLPFAPAAGGGKSTYRNIRIDGEDVEFSEGFTDLHTRVYQELLDGRGHGLDVARPSIQLVHDIRQVAQSAPGTEAHPYVRR